MRFWLCVILATTAHAAPPVVKPKVQGPQPVVVVPAYPLPGNPHWQRYIFVGSGAPIDFAALDWSVTMTINRRAVRVPLCATPDPKVAMIDFGELVNTFEELHSHLALWEQFALDEPHFMGQIILNPDGKTITRLPNPHPAIGPMVARLQRSNLTQVPIVEMRWLLNRKLLSTTDGGQYYSWIGAPATLDGFLKKFSGTTEKEVLAMKSASKAVQLIRKVTEKPGAILAYHGIGGRSGINGGQVFITFDIFDNTRDPQFLAPQNAVDTKRQAAEVILERANGTHAFFLANEKGDRVDSVPDTVASDTEIPGNFTKRLQPAIGCIRCHGPEDGLRKVTADQIELPLGPITDVNVLNRDRDAFEALLSEQLTKPLQRARDDYSDAVVSITKDYGLDVDQKGLAAQLSSIARDYLYTSIGEEQAMRELATITRQRFPKGSRINEILGDRLRGNPFREALFPNRDKFTGQPIVKVINRTEFENILPDMIQDLRPDLMRPETDPVEPEELEPVERSVLVPERK